VHNGWRRQTIFRAAMSMFPPVTHPRPRNIVETWPRQGGPATDIVVPSAPTLRPRHRLFIGDEVEIDQ